MPRLLLTLTILCVVLCALTPMAVRGQDATPAGEAIEGTEPIVRITDADLASSDLGVIGFVRTVFEPGAELALSADEGPALLWVESGSLAILPGDGSSALAVNDRGSGIADSVSPLAAGEESALEAGQAVVLPAGSAATIRNAGNGPAVTLDLLPLADVEAQPATGVNQRLIARHDTAVPPAPFAIELGRATIQPKEQYPDPANAIDFLLMSVDPAQLFALTRNNFNRGTSPMDIYVLTVIPMEDGMATPSA